MVSVCNNKIQFLTVGLLVSLFCSGRATPLAYWFRVSHGGLLPVSTPLLCLHVFFLWVCCDFSGTQSCVWQLLVLDSLFCGPACPLSTYGHVPFSYDCWFLGIVNRLIWEWYFQCLLNQVLLFQVACAMAPMIQKLFMITWVMSWVVPWFTYFGLG